MACQGIHKVVFDYRVSWRTSLTQQESSSDITLELPNSNSLTDLTMHAQ